MKEKGIKMDYMVGTMIELPRAALIADQIAKEAEFFSFGTNDLTQMTFGFSRDDAGTFLATIPRRDILDVDPFQTIDQEGVGQIEDGHREGPRHQAEPEGRHLRRARRRPGQRGVLPPGGHELRDLLAVPRADRAAGGGARQAQGKGRGRIRDEVMSFTNQKGGRNTGRLFFYSPPSRKEQMMITTNGITIYETLAEIVDPAHSCLVVWDVQNGLVDRIFNKEEFLANLKGLIETLRKKMPVAYTLITPLPREFQSAWASLQYDEAL